MRVLVCGGRDYANRDRLFKLLDFNRAKITTVIQGGAKGADALAAQWAGLRAVPLENYPADWDRYGKRAGFVRNTQMLVEGKPDLVVAFPGGVGTRMMVTIAKNAGVRVIEVPR